MATGTGTGTPATSTTAVSSASVGPRVLHIEPLSLERFRRVFGFHPWHFWQLADVSKADYVAKAPYNGTCDSIVREFQHNGNALNGRSDMRAALAEANGAMMQMLGFPITRTWVTETVKISRRVGDCAEFITSLGYVRRVGRLVNETLSAGLSVTYEDRDNDGLKETFTITTPVLASATADEELIVRTLAADSIDGTQREIAPLRIVRNVNGTATISGAAWLCVKPSRYEGEYRIPPTGGAQTNDSLDPNTTANFVAQLELIRRYTDVSTGATLTKDKCLAGCNCSTTGVCCTGGALADGTFAVSVRDSRLGICAVSGCLEGDYVTLTYEAGFDDPTKGVDLDRVVARLAATMMNGVCVACASAPGHHEFIRWQTDRAYYGQFQGFREATGANNPFNTREGAIWAWEQVKHLKIYKARR